jgi:hypothetical protein
MGSFLERLQVESVPGLYSTTNVGHPEKVCAFLRKKPPPGASGRGACIRHYTNTQYVESEEATVQYGAGRAADATPNCTYALLTFLFPMHCQLNICLADKFKFDHLF